MYLDDLSLTQFSEEMHSGQGVRADEIFIIMLAESSAGQADAIIEAMRAAGQPFIGAVFPMVIYGDKAESKGAVIKHLPACSPPLSLSGLSHKDFAELASIEPHDRKDDEDCTAIVFTDALSPHNGALLASLFDAFGDSFQFFGGGAGYHDLRAGPCIFSQTGLMQDAAVVAFVRQRSHLASRHGWQRTGEAPFIATRVEGLCVHELNWENAFDLYSRELAATGQPLSDRNSFFNLAKSHPFGLYREGDEDVVRDPAALTEQGGIRFISDIPENSVMHILHGEASSLLAASERAVQMAAQKTQQDIEHCLIADCLSRTMVLGDDFPQELTRLSACLRKIAPECVPEGVLSIGEISTGDSGQLEMFNKTIVVDLLHA